MDTRNVDLPRDCLKEYQQIHYATQSIINKQAYSPQSYAETSSLLQRVEQLKTRIHTNNNNASVKLNKLNHIQHALQLLNSPSTLIHIQQLVQSYVSDFFTQKTIHANENPQFKFKEQNNDIKSFFAQCLEKSSISVKNTGSSLQHGYETSLCYLNNFLSTLPQNQKNQVESLIQALKEALCTSYCLNIFETQSNAVHHEQYLSAAAIFSIQKLTKLSTSEYMCIPAGYSAKPSGHALLLLIQKNTDQSFDVHVINTGEGIKYHPYSSHKGVKQPNTLIYERVPVNKLNLDFFISLFQMRTNDHEGQPYKIDDFYNLLYAKLYHYNIKSGHPIEPQKHDTCWYQCIQALIKHKMGNELFQTYQNHTTKNAIETFRARFLDSKEVGIVNNPQNTNSLLDRIKNYPCRNKDLDNPSKDLVKKLEKEANKYLVQRLLKHPY